MKNVFFYALLMVGLIMGSCNQKAAAPKAEEKMSTESKPVNIKLSELATNKDLNCDMPLTEGAIADTAQYEGKVYGFCSTECKADFLKNPQAEIAKK
jgi:YHS domain-containing protein